jgi:site-specific recombinase XerD
MMTSLSPLLERFSEHMQSRHLAPATQRSYIHYVTKFARYHGRDPEQLDPDAVREFQRYMLEKRGHSPDSVNTFISAARFLYLETLKMPWNKNVFVRTAVPKKPRATVIPADVRKLFEHVPGIKHRAALMLCYGAGLTAAEAVAVKTANIDSRNLLLRVEHRNGGKDRYAPLSPGLLDLLRTYWLVARPAGPWLFPSWRSSHHIGAGILRRACNEAWQLAGLPRHVSPRTLRQSFAGCLLHKSVDQRVVQALLGHGSTGAPAKVDPQASPLDLLLVGNPRRKARTLKVPKPE